MSYSILAGLLLSLCLAPFLCASEPTQTTELAKGWKLIEAKKVTATGSNISQPAYKTNHWHPIRSVPATVLEILAQDGVYPNVYYGMNLMTEVPQNLYKEDWWYRTSFQVPA
ncbi:MAG: glycosyl hydrolase 2 galactose-binding domain-containing protein, partial [Bryobacteraceae bacterium]